MNPKYRGPGLVLDFLDFQRLILHSHSFYNGRFPPQC
jgi:hypothetical protein